MTLRKEAQSEFGLTASDLEETWRLLTPEDRLEAFLRDGSAWVREGRIRYREDIVEGLEAAPRALIGLLEGKNFGKLLVRVSEDPTRRP